MRAVPRHFTADWVEHATLRDGTRVQLRLTVPEDTELLRRGFEKWSPESRYARFLAPKARLTDEELHYLCDVDQEHHVSLGAVGESGDGLGIARFIRLADVEPATADAAVAVADEVQGQGLGRLLFLRLAAAALERGIERFRCDVLCSNTGMKALLDELAPERSIEVGMGVMSIDFPVPHVAADAAEPPAGPMYRFFRATASGAATTRGPASRSDAP